MSLTVFTVSVSTLGYSGPQEYFLVWLIALQQIRGSSGRYNPPSSDYLRRPMQRHRDRAKYNICGSLSTVTSEWRLSSALVYECVFNWPKSRRPRRDAVSRGRRSLCTITNDCQMFLASRRLFAFVRHGLEWISEICQVTANCCVDYWLVHIGITMRYVMSPFFTTYWIFGTHFVIL